MGGRLSEDMLAAVVCDRTGWTYEEYLATPEIFIQALMIKWQEDAVKANEENKK